MAEIAADTALRNKLMLVADPMQALPMVVGALIPDTAIVGTNRSVQATVALKAHNGELWRLTMDITNNDEGCGKGELSEASKAKSLFVARWQNGNLTVWGAGVEHLTNASSCNDKTLDNMVAALCQKVNLESANGARFLFVPSDEQLPDTETHSLEMIFEGRGQEVESRKADLVGVVVRTERRKKLALVSQNSQQSAGAPVRRKKGKRPRTENQEKLRGKGQPAQNSQAKVVEQPIAREAGESESQTPALFPTASSESLLPAGRRGGKRSSSANSQKSDESSAGQLNGLNTPSTPKTPSAQASSAGVADKALVERMVQGLLNCADKPRSDLQLKGMVACFVDQRLGATVESMREIKEQVASLKTEVLTVTGEYSKALDKLAQTRKDLSSMEKQLVKKEGLLGQQQRQIDDLSSRLLRIETQHDAWEQEESEMSSTQDGV